MVGTLVDVVGTLVAEIGTVVRTRRVEELAVERGSDRRSGK